MQTSYDPTSESLNTAPTVRLRKLSIWKMILFTFITLGLYMPYWIYTRTKALNFVNEEESVSELFTNFAAGLFLLTYGFDLVSEFIKPEPGIAGAFKFLGIVSNFLLLFWALMFRTGLNVYTRAKKRDDLWSNGFFTWLFQAFYHQYKINQILETQDKENNVPSNLGNG